MKRLEVCAIPVESAPQESESNGSVENGVKLFEGMLGVHLLALERKAEGQHSQSTHRDDLAGGVCGGHRDQVHLRMVGQATRGCLASRCTKKVWSLENEFGGVSIGLMT